MKVVWCRFYEFKYFCRKTELFYPLKTKWFIRIMKFNNSPFGNKRPWDHSKYLLPMIMVVNFTFMPIFIFSYFCNFICFIFIFPLSDKVCFSLHVISISTYDRLEKIFLATSQILFFLLFISLSFSHPHFFFFLKKYYFYIFLFF